MFYQDPSIIYKLIHIIKEANTILRNERDPKMSIGIKKNKRTGAESKVTRGGIKSNEVITNQIYLLNNELISSHIGFFNLLSEETVDMSDEKLSNPLIDGTWCIDSLDGIDEYCCFTIEKPTYTCNIGLIMNGEPVLGIFGVPESGTIYYGIKGVGSYKINDENNIDYEANSSFPGIKLTIPKKDINKSGIRVAVSSLGVNHATKEFIDSELNDQVCSSFSGSLKFGALADGTVDIYPVFGLTREWETCAGDAVVRYAGGGVYIHNSFIDIKDHNEFLTYNKNSLVNPNLIVF